MNFSKTWSESNCIGNGWSAKFDLHLVDLLFKLRADSVRLVCLDHCVKVLSSLSSLSFISTWITVSRSLLFLRFPVTDTEMRTGLIATCTSWFWLERGGLNTKSSKWKSGETTDEDNVELARWQMTTSAAAEGDKEEKRMKMRLPQRQQWGGRCLQGEQPGEPKGSKSAVAPLQQWLRHIDKISTRDCWM